MNRSEGDANLVVMEIEIDGRVTELQKRVVLAIMGGEANVRTDLGGGAWKEKRNDGSKLGKERS